MATVNTFLAPGLSSTKTKTGAVSFVDNRQKTFTPYPYIESILPGKNGVQGWIGEITADSKRTPEPNAYIYIYINGFLVNPPEIRPDATYKDLKTTYLNLKTAIVSDEKGDWKTGEFFFDSIPAFQYGQTITFRAKAPLKQISDRSIPYLIGGMPSPIDIGVIGENGELRAPYEGEYSIVGRMSYWLNSTDNPGKPNFDCNNHIYVYLDGVHAGTNTGGIGEVFKNEIRGSDAKFPVTSSMNNRYLALMVDNTPVNVPMVDLRPIDTSPLFKTIDLNTNQPVYVFGIPADNVGVKVFRNGIRQKEGLDYTYSANIATKQGTIKFTISSGDLVDADTLLALFQYETSAFALGEVPSGVIDGSNDTFTLLDVPKTGTLEVYRNGLHISPNEYTLSGKNIIFDVDPLFLPQTDDTLLVDYQPLSNSTQLVYYTNPLELADGVRQQFSFILPPTIGNPHVYKNGLLQKEGLFYDYTLIDKNVIKFTPWNIPNPEDLILIIYYTSPVLLEQVISYLNNTAEFKENCITATTLNIKPIQNSFILEGVKNDVNTLFVLPITDVPVNIRIFKNGIRLKEDLDYILDHARGLIIFEVPPSAADSLIGLFNYIISDFVVSETPMATLDPTIWKIGMVPKASTVQVYYNGIRLNQFDPNDYTIAQNEIRFGFTPAVDDVILVDYEVAFGFTTFTKTVQPLETITGTNTEFTFSTDLLTKGAAVHVFKNGLLQQEVVDYVIDRTKISFREDTKPEAGDVLLIEINYAGLFTNNPNDQLRLISPYAIQLKPYKLPKITNEIPSSKVDGTNRIVYSLKFMPKPETVRVMYNGQRLSPSSYVVNLQQLLFKFSTSFADLILVDYDTDYAYEFDFVQKLLFGSSAELYPGKDIDGTFLFFFNRRTGHWKWSAVDPVTRLVSPFKTGQHITARAKNDTDIIYKVAI